MTLPAVWDSLAELAAEARFGREWSEVRKGLELYAREVVRWRTTVNLTSAKSIEEVVETHIGDSLVACYVASREGFDRIVDLGSGAGFPGIPAAICFPDKNVYLVEPRLRRSLFLERCCRLLKLENSEVVRERAENLARGERLVVGQICFARAVGRLATVSTLARPLVDDGGRLLVHVGPEDDVIDWGQGWIGEGVTEWTIGDRVIRVAMARALRSEEEPACSEKK